MLKIMKRDTVKNIEKIGIMLCLLFMYFELKSPGILEKILNKNFSFVNMLILIIFALILYLMMVSISVRAHGGGVVRVMMEAFTISVFCLGASVSMYVDFAVERIDIKTLYCVSGLLCVCTSVILFYEACKVLDDKFSRNKSMIERCIFNVIYISMSGFLAVVACVCLWLYSSQ